MIKFKRTAVPKVCIGCYNSITNDDKFYDGEHWWHRSCMDAYVAKMEALNNKRKWTRSK